MNDQGRRKIDSAKAAALAGWLRIRDREEAAAGQPPVEQEVAGEGDAGEDSLLDRYMPTPQVAAVAVMALLAAGVVLGAVTDPFAQSASPPTILVSSPSAAPEEEESAPEVVEEVVEEEAPGPEAAAVAPLIAPEEEVIEEPYEEAAPKPKKPPFELAPETPLPPVTHLFMIVLGEQGYEAAFGAGSLAPYLSKTLTEKGELLQNYYAVAPGGLANEIALLSGQGPTAQTAAGCPESTDVTPGTVSPATIGTTELVEGAGCVYPAATLTLPGQLRAAGQTWRAYVEDSAPAACGPGPSPFAFFHSLLDNGECGESVVGIEQLATDLKAKVSTEVPALSYIVPGACHDGSEVPCAPGAPAGLAGAESFLETVVPEIEASDAYKVGGMIAITFAGAPQSGAQADSSACCATPEYPGLAAPGAAPVFPDEHGVKPSGGGGRVGMLLLSPYVLPGSVDETGYFNHFSFLHSVEELFGLAPLGYAAEPAVIPFDEAVYNNAES